MIDVEDALRTIVESSASPVTLTEVQARSEARESERRRSRRPILVAVVTVVVVAAAVGAALRASNHTPSRSRTTNVVKPTLRIPTTPSTVLGPSPTVSADYFSVPNASTAWIVGRTPDSTAVHVLNTVDGGTTWSDATPSTLPANASAAGLFAIDGTHAVLAIDLGPETDQSQGAILHTDDAGRTWTSVPIPLYSALEFSFVDATHGWAEASLGAAAGSEAVDIYRTVDGGADWGLMSRSATPAGDPGTAGGLPAGCDKTGITFVDADTGFATGACAAGAFLYVTHDAGRTWSRASIQGSLVSPDGNNDATIPPPVFSGAQGTTSATVEHETFMLVTPDQGSTWSVKGLSVGSPTVPVDVVDPTHWWFVARSKLEHTTNAGALWAARARPDGTIQLLHFVNEDLGWAVTDTGLLYVTRDGARSWSLVDPIPPFSGDPAGLPDCIPVDSLSASDVGCELKRDFVAAHPDPNLPGVPVYDDKGSKPGAVVGYIVAGIDQFVPLSITNDPAKVAKLKVCEDELLHKRPLDDGCVPLLKEWGLQPGFFPK